MKSVTGKVRREVPLPSQEGKKGVMQYALYVFALHMTAASKNTAEGDFGCGKVLCTVEANDFHPEQPSIK